MKKVFILFAVALFTVPLLAGCEERRIGPEDLPDAARQFINTSYTQTTIRRLKMDRERDQTTYEVYFKDGSKIEFDGRGEMKEMESGRDGYIPMVALPEPIRHYVNLDHAGENVRKIERDSDGYEVKLTNGREVKFDRQMNFIEYDHGRRNAR